MAVGATVPRAAELRVMGGWVCPTTRFSTEAVIGCALDWQGPISWLTIIKIALSKPRSLSGAIKVEIRKTS